MNLKITLLTATSFILTGLLSPALAQSADAPEIPARVTDFVLAEGPDDHVLGSDDAVQTLIVYASVTCPHCSTWFTDEWPKVQTELVDTGLLRFVFREFPTAPAALAMTGFLMAECAPSEDYMSVIEYQMVEQAQIFKDAQEGRGREAYNKIAKLAGMESDESINACLGNPDMLAHIQDNSLRADLGKVRGVPAFFINGESYGGAQDAKSLIDLITDMDEKGITALPADMVAPEQNHADHSGHNHD